MPLIPHMADPFFIPSLFHFWLYQKKVFVGNSVIRLKIKVKYLRSTSLVIRRCQVPASEIWHQDVLYNVVTAAPVSLIIATFQSKLIHNINPLIDPPDMVAWMLLVSRLLHAKQPHYFTSQCVAVLRGNAQYFAILRDNHLTQCIVRKMCYVP